MSKYTDIKTAEKTVRSSQEYHRWAERNLGPACLHCDKEENLQVHHIISLYHILLGLWKLYGDINTVISHAIDMHSDDNCESVTLCKECHSKIHPGKKTKEMKTEIRIEEWIVYPRHLPGQLLHNPKTANEKGMSLVGFQILAGIGWYILNGHLDSNMITFKRVAMAHLIGKDPSTSFYRSLHRAINDLEEIGVIKGFIRNGPEVEIHLSEKYLNSLSNPWFMSVNDIKSNKMSVLSLKWFLSLQSRKKVYSISKENLSDNIGMKCSTPAFMDKCIGKSIQEIPWASYRFNGKAFIFHLKPRGAVPIWTLRSILSDSIREGKS